MKNKKKGDTLLMEKINFLSHRPKFFYSPNNKVANTVFNYIRNSFCVNPNRDCYHKEGTYINLASYKEKKAQQDIQVYIKLDNYKIKNEEINLEDKEISKFDREVHDAIITLFKNNLQCMSPKMIVRTMFANHKMSIHSNILEAVTNSINKMRNTLIELDISEEAEARNFENLEIEEPVITAKWVATKINGQNTNALLLSCEPPLLRYAECSNQILKIDLNFMQLPLNLENTVENLMLRNYLLRQILIISNKKNSRNNSMLFQTILNFLGITLDKCKSKERFIKKKSILKSKIEKLLEFWKKEDLFENFTLEKNGYQLRSIIISPKKIFKAKNNKKFASTSDTSTDTKETQESI